MTDPVLDYLGSLAPAERSVIEHYFALARAVVPEAVPARKYAMPCYALDGKGLIAVMVTKGGLSIIPFTGALNGPVAAKYGAAGEFGVSAGGGSLHCTVERPLPDDAFVELVRLRAEQIR
jgi:uncharacterized protein YdhG (YjbR/CyaY superfamily)